MKQIQQLIPISEAKLFGIMENGEAISIRELQNCKGMSFKVITYGATITELKIPLKNGTFIDVVLGFDNLDAYINSFLLPSAPYLGATIGRFAGRISNGEFQLNDEKYFISKNNSNHSLHGGNIGFSQKIWKLKKVVSGKNPSITFQYISADGEENYPGELQVELTYTITDENELVIEYIATTTKDTIVNLTHHCYFNLNGHDSEVLSQEMAVNANKVLETTTENIPTGVFLDLVDSLYDFSSPKKCPSVIDNTFVLDKEKDVAASLYSPKNNLKMTVYTDQPSAHIYVGGNCFNQIIGKENANYHALSGICFETQNFPDAPNQVHFPNSVLKTGETYSHKTRYKFELV